MNETNRNPSEHWEGLIRNATRSGALHAPPTDSMAAVLLEQSVATSLPPAVDEQALATMKAALLDRRVSQAAAGLATGERSSSLGGYLSAALDLARVSRAEWAERLGTSVRALDSFLRSDAAALRLSPQAIATILDAMNLSLSRARRMLSAAIDGLAATDSGGGMGAVASIPQPDLKQSLTLLLDGTEECLRQRDRDDLAGMQ